MKKSKKSTEDTTKTTNKNHNNNNNNTKFFLNLIYLFLVLGLLVFVLFSYDRTQTNQVEERSYTDLVTDIREGKISKIELLESKDKLK
jgi:FtsH-binding integral membrane protein